jgi:type VI protein secretion system component VasF
MLSPLLILALVGSMGLLAALRPETYARYFLTKWQRSGASRNPRALSRTGWAIFGVCVFVIVALPLQKKWYLMSPFFGPLLDLVCASAYVWWGIGLLRSPESFLKRAGERWRRIPTWIFQAFGLLLLFGAAGFVYGFAASIKGLLP